MMVVPDVRFCDVLLGTIMHVTTFVAFGNYVYFSLLLTLFGAIIVCKYKHYYVPPYEKIKFKEDDDEDEESQFKVLDDIENGSHKEDKMEFQAFLAVVDDEVKHMKIMTVSS
ncbi:hypothetical protein JCGZ_01236 [Jatropha curcas]|uniref:Uncharacterized protein n=1 Tax=Jatropha curcas TaxID=180498 RepID=A0A067L8I1_JATCU|nr:hypothetical protein JCGZ_01236 [Jatropha curcas]